MVFVCMGAEWSLCLEGFSDLSICRSIGLIVDNQCSFPLEIKRVTSATYSEFWVLDVIVRSLIYGHYRLIGDIKLYLINPTLPSVFSLMFKLLLSLFSFKVP